MPFGWKRTGPDEEFDMPEHVFDGDDSETGLLTAIVDRQPPPPERLVGEQLARAQQECSVMIAAAVEEFHKVAQERHFVD